MKEFMVHDFHITAIDGAWCVRGNEGAMVHRNRLSHGLVLMTAGENRYTFEDGQVCSSEKNRILYLPQGSNYRVDRVELGCCYAINFQLAEPHHCPPFTFKIKSSIYFAECFKAAEYAWRTQAFGMHMLCKSHLCAIIGAMQSEYGLGYVAKETTELLTPALEYIQQEFSRTKIKISDLAALCGISESYFRRIFCSSMGCSPIQYIRNLRLNCAKNLLQSGMYTVSAAAALSGFQDDCYFSREFKKSAGVSPSEYARERDSDELSEFME